VAPALVVNHRAGLTDGAEDGVSIDWGAVAGREFYKMCGSGNDFVFFDALTVAAGMLGTEGAMRALCARATGVGADGVVFLEPADPATEGAALRMRYHNSDGSRASMCGNAALCTTRLAVELGRADPSGFTFVTDAGLIRARIRDGQPEIELSPVERLQPDAELGRIPGERRIGYARAGVPHLVVEVDDVEAVDLAGRGRTLRFDPSLADGANVNFVAPAAGGWRMRTYERGVEGETLACGTGAVACAAVLASWGAAPDQAVTILTSSGRPLVVTLPLEETRGPSLRGEGRIVFRGELREPA
jgi:diaminopimelate epimerase